MSGCWRIAVGVSLALAVLAGEALASGARRDDVAFARGAQVAQARCANCHAIALETKSPEAHAPAFRVLSRLYDEDVLARKLAAFAEVGHFEMPPVALREEEIADVAAYIANLDGGEREDPRRANSPLATVARPTPALARRRSAIDVAAPAS